MYQPAPNNFAHLPPCCRRELASVIAFRSRNLRPGHFQDSICGPTACACLAGCASCAALAHDWHLIQLFEITRVLSSGCGMMILRRYSVIMLDDKFTCGVIFRSNWSCQRKKRRWTLLRNYKRQRFAPPNRTWRRPGGSNQPGRGKRRGRSAPCASTTCLAR